VPEAVAAVVDPFVAAGAAEEVGVLPELVVAVDEAEADDARADVGGDDEVDKVIGEALAVLPAAVGGLLHGWVLLVWRVFCGESIEGEGERSGTRVLDGEGRDRSSSCPAASPFTLSEIDPFRANNVAYDTPYGCRPGRL
jgi:hypothetical protein